MPVARRKGRRRPGKREPRRAITVFAEGRVTEVEYLKAIRGELHLPKELVDIRCSNCNDPLKLVKTAITERSKAGGGMDVTEHWWVLADTEGCNGSPHLLEAVKLAQAKGIWLGLSEPSVEFWLLLHLSDASGSFSNAKSVIRRLQRAGLAGYDEKNKHPDMAKLREGLPLAMERARHLREQNTKHGLRAPFTDLDLLVDDINCQASDDRALFSKRQPTWEDLAMNLLQLE